MKLQRCCTDFRGTGVLQLCNECFLGSQGFLKLHFSRTFLMCIQQLFPVEGSHITWRVILPTPFRLYNTSLCVCLKMLAASCVCARVPLQKIPCNPVHNHKKTHSSASRTGESLLLHLLLEGQDMVLLLFQL